VADVSVRPAGLADVPEIARVQRETWRQAYSAWLPPEILDEVTPEVAEQTWGAAVAQPPGPRHHVLVALEQQWIAGFAAFSPAEPDPEAADAGAHASGPVGQVDALLVEPRWGRRGHGSRLLAATVDLMRADGVRTATVWLPEQDGASLAFFTSAGWERDGYARTLETDGGASMTELRLHVSLED
jgi:GNAT superfamily N-acetyltransferase